MTMCIEARPATLTQPARRASIVRVLSHALSVWQQRQHLKTLDDSALEDIGVSYRAANSEAHRPVWDMPSYWRR